MIWCIFSSKSESRSSCAQLHSVKFEYSDVLSECELRQQNKNKGHNFAQLWKSDTTEQRVYWYTHWYLVYDFDTSILFTTCFGNYLSVSMVSNRFVFAFSVVRTVQRTGTWKMREIYFWNKGNLVIAERLEVNEWFKLLFTTLTGLKVSEHILGVLSRSWFCG